MLIDLHSHSFRSDGTDAPADLVEHAAAASLDVIALTDHDTADGWEEATETANRTGIRLVTGMEISCQYDGTGVHLLAYLLDPAHPPLAEELRRIVDGRASRLPTTIARLRKAGIAITLDDVRRVAGRASAAGRPHVADALVELGVVQDRSQAFDRYLSWGRPGFVRRYASELTTMIRLVGEAGGVTVIAHPWSRGSRRVLTVETLSELAAAGLAGIEVDHHDHDPAIRERLRAIAGDAGLIVTGGSDYHGRGKTGYRLGDHTTDPDQFERLLAAAREGSR